MCGVSASALNPSGKTFKNIIERVAERTTGLGLMRDIGSKTYLGNPRWVLAQGGGDPGHDGTAFVQTSVDRLCSPVLL